MPSVVGRLALVALVVVERGEDQPLLDRGDLAADRHLELAVGGRRPPRRVRIGSDASIASSSISRSARMNALCTALRSSRTLPRHGPLRERARAPAAQRFSVPSAAFSDVEEVLGEQLDVGAARRAAAAGGS